jgi:hypothetical protein
MLSHRTVRQTFRINIINRVAPNITLKIDTSIKFNRVLGDESADARVIVSGAVKISSFGFYAQAPALLLEVREKTDISRPGP